jgi:ABC-type uncharacterized transport system ATPase subunit
MSVELRNVTKRFGELVANDSINLKVENKQIHAILGENGAGKSTLMNILYGLYSPDSGEFFIDEKSVKINNPEDAISLGIGMVHQHFMLVPIFTVAENLVLGREKVSKLGKLDLAAARERVREISAKYKLEVDPDSKIEDLPVGVQQRVEIIKALSLDVKVLILDEPTAVLTPQETDELLQIMRNLRDEGTSIIFITHKLREVKEVADVITVIRRGKVVGTANPSESADRLAQLMVGRPVELNSKRDLATSQDEVLNISDLTIKNHLGAIMVKNVSLKVNAGEVLAVAGVQGNGQTELARAIINLEKLTTGSISLNGKVISGGSIKSALSSGIAYIPESRELDGLVGGFTIYENLILDVIEQTQFSKGGILNPAAITKFAEEKKNQFDIRAQDINSMASSLSGGNKQKVVLARELSKEVSLVVASQPTRGLDIGSIEFVHKKILEQRAAGKAVLLFSTELDEIYALADRIAVMYKGEIIDIVNPSTPPNQIGMLMAGVK